MIDGAIPHEVLAPSEIHQCRRIADAYAIFDTMT